MAESHTAGQQALMQHGRDPKFRAAPEIRAAQIEFMLQGPNTGVLQKPTPRPCMSLYLINKASNHTDTFLPPTLHDPRILPTCRALNHALSL